MHQAFNFAYLETPWDAAGLRAVIDESLAAFGAVGAPSTWVLSNHDVVRHATRLALTGRTRQGHGIGPTRAGSPIAELGLRRARAATALMLALPGSAYLYQGEELGLPEVIDLPDDARQDPTWFRTGRRALRPRRLPRAAPWVADAPAYGFSPTGASWLPQPARVGRARARPAARRGRLDALAVPRRPARCGACSGLGAGVARVDSRVPDDVVAFRNGDVVVVANTGDSAVELPAGDVLLASEPLADRTLAPDTTVWLRV